MRKQSSGGAIGVKAAGDIANLLVCCWDRDYLRKVNETLKELNLYLRYVDDEYIICEVIPENEENRDQEKGRTYHEGTTEDRKPNTPIDKGYDRLPFK